VAARTDVAILVLNWNGADLLERHLPAVVACTRGARTATRVYVVDNGSTDASRSTAARFEDVDLIAFPDNRKLVAYNDAARQVECEAFLALNNDSSPAPGAVDALWETLQSAPDVFAAGGLVVDEHSGEIDSGPTDIRWEGEWVVDATGLAGADGPIDVAYVSGGAALYRRDRFLELGGFWPVLPALYWEDTDLGLRAWLHGWRSVFCPDAEFRHDSGATVRRTISPRRLEFGVYRNRRLIHLSLLLRGSDMRRYLAAELRRSLRKPYYWPASLALLPRVPAALRRRRELRRRLGPVGVEELRRRWSGPAG
jgi:GT2 family glycosyltransferase